MKILIAGFQHETNTFAPTKAKWEDFVHGGGMPSMTHGVDVLKLRGINIPIGGFLNAMHNCSHELIPVIWSNACPSAEVTEDAYERISDIIVGAAAKTKPDGVYLDIHGAMVAEHVNDGEGELIRRLRNVLGDKVPVVCSLDLHANVTKLMLEQADALVAYRTYPHVDMDKTGERAALLLKMILEEDKSLSLTWRRIPFLMPLHGQCTDMEPASSTYKYLESIEQGSIISMSFTPGFPAADFHECGGVVWGYGTNQSKIKEAVDSLSNYINQRESEWWIDLYNPDEAVKKAMLQSELATGPVVIADTQDNPGAGGNSNTTGMLRALIKNNAQEAALGVLFDPLAAKAAHEKGVGKTIEIGLGGEAAIGDKPFEGTFTIEHLSDGNLTIKGPMMRGAKISLGPTACLRIGGVKIVVGSNKVQMLDRELFRVAGVDPEKMKILVNKSSVHFRADFTPIAHKILVAESPGPMIADPINLPWKNLKPGIRIRPNGPRFTK